MRTQAGVDGDVRNVVGHLRLEEIGLCPGVGAQDPFGLKGREREPAMIGTRV